MNVGQSVVITVVPLDKDGNVTTFPSGTVPTFAPIDASMATVTQGADGLSETLKALKVGTITDDISVVLNGATVTHTAAVAVVAGDATDFRIDVGAPQ